MAIPSTTLDLFNRLKHETIITDSGPISIVRDFAVFIDTHRDQPHVGTFHGDIHRGECRPTTVHARMTTDIKDKGQRVIQLIHPETGMILPLHPKHLFVGAEWYETWFVNWIMEHGTGPLDDEGKMVTTHFRDPREKRYVLKTFGHMVRERATKDGVRY
jgi:hypothetical protein